ncbi:gamma-glutamylcyclotransferase-like [Musca vetustissima]|uniref:gamma-glutamylcyclotransferase-like n=1 Tax=Musca vetustissima TaxID=27455 RepID=UPI002AB6BD6E|nr:gamma-glutamylcyclotransferase-like [Musca vetustissima]
MAAKFYYFGFGSNLLAKRLHLQNPTAVRIGPGKLENFRLDFNLTTDRWYGACATIVPNKGEYVWGAIWELDESDMEHLDNQEGVHQGIYTPITVSVYCPTLDSNIECRAYHLCEQPDTNLNTLPINEIPSDRLPSATYLKSLVKGAMESDIPYEYIDWLMHIPHNGNIAERFELELELDGIELYNLVKEEI